MLKSPMAAMSAPLNPVLKVIVAPGASQVRDLRCDRGRDGNYGKYGVCEPRGAAGSAGPAACVGGAATDVAGSILQERAYAQSVRAAEGIRYTTRCTWVQRERKAAGRPERPEAVVRFAEV